MPAKRDLDAAGYKLSALKSIDFTDFSEVTIASGAITVTQTCHTVDTEGNAASDDLDTINGGTNGMPIYLRPASDSRTVVIKHNTGNIWISGTADVTLDDIRDLIALIYDGTKWSDVGGAGVLASAHARQHAVTSTSDHTSTATPGKVLKADANGLPVDATNTDTQVSGAVTASHTRSHAVTSTSDHTSSATSGKMLKADANGLPVDATNTDAEVVDAVTKKHTQNTDSDLSPAHKDTATGVHGVGGSTVESASGSQSKVDTHGALTTAIHGVGGSTIESTSGSQGKVNTHAALTTAIHGVGGSTVESTSGSQSKVDTHAALTTGVHGVGAGTIAKVGDIAVDANLSAAAQDAVSKRHDRSHTLLSTSDHSDVATYLDQAVKQASTPTFAGLTMTGNIVMPDGGTIGQAAGPLLAFDDTSDYLEITGCNVGIGTTAPSHLLNVLGGASGAETALLEIRSNATAASTGTTLRLVNSTVAGSSRAAEIAAIRDAGALTDIIFRSGGGAIVERCRITGAGNVGIGTATVDYILQVVQDSSTDPIADAWTTYTSDRTRKDIVGSPSGYLEKFKKMNTYLWKRKPEPTDNEVDAEIALLPEVELAKKDAVEAYDEEYEEPKLDENGKPVTKKRKRFNPETGLVEEYDDPVMEKKTRKRNRLKDGARYDEDADKFYLKRRRADLSQIQLDEAKQRAKDKKSLLPKYQAERLGIMLDDPDIPSEIVIKNSEGTIQGLDLGAYIGFLHQVIKEHLT